MAKSTSATDILGIIQRPRQRQRPSVAVNVRLEADLSDELHAYAAFAGTSKSAVVQAAIRRILRQDTAWLAFRRRSAEGEKSIRIKESS